MTEVKPKQVVNFIKKSQKITDVDQNSYHKRVHMKEAFSGPCIDVIVSKGGPLSTKPTKLTVKYGHEDVFITENEVEVAEIIKGITEKETKLKDDVIEKKKKEFLKLAEDE